MSKLKSGAILLLLAIPFVLYILWQVQGVTRADLSAAEPPAEKNLPDKEKLEKTKLRTDKWVGDIHKASGMVLQYRQSDGNDPLDDDCRALTKASAKRSAPLTNLRSLLDDAKNPQFVGDTKGLFQDWHDQNKSLREAEGDVRRWLDDRLPTIDGPTAADTAYRAFDAKLVKYTAADSPFKNRALVVGWKVQARGEIVKALAEAARKPYEAAIQLPLPLPSEADNKDVRTAVGALREMKEQIRRLEKEVTQAKAEGLILADDVQAARKAALRASEEWAARDELLSLYADRSLFTDPDKAGEWLTRVKVQYDRTQDDGRTDGRAEIRKKVQQFCAAYIPPVAKLDDKVMLRDKAYPRNAIKLEYTSVEKEQLLTHHPETLNEFNYKTKIQGLDRIRYDSSSTGVNTPIVPTQKSTLAYGYTEARKDVKTWTLEGVRELKKKCGAKLPGVEKEMLAAEMDSLEGLNMPGETGTAWTRGNTRIWSRLAALEAGMAENEDLFRGPK